LAISLVEKQFLGTKMATARHVSLARKQEREKSACKKEKNLLHLEQENSLRENGEIKKTLQNLTTVFGEILTLDLTSVCI